MTVYFFNGGSPAYLGQVFTTSTSLLTTIKDNLLSAGWSLQSDQISANSYVIMKGTTDNTHYCWVKFSTFVQSAGVEERLRIQGDLDGNNTTLSGTGIYLSYKPSVNNYLYITADNDSGCICIYPDTSLVTRGGHFGFIDRIDTSDQYAWSVGDLDITGLDNKYVAKSKHNNTNWRQISDDFSGSDNCTTMGTNSCAPIQGIFDRYTVAYTFGATSPLTNTATSNAAYQAYNGRVNPVTNYPILDSYFYLEGRGSTTAYGSSMGGGLYYRGDIKHAVTGIASYVGAVQLVTTDSQRFISAGGVGWQGFRIA